MNRGKNLGKELMQKREIQTKLQAQLEQIRKEYAMKGKVTADGDIIEDEEMREL